MSKHDSRKSKALLQGYRPGEGLEETLPDMKRALDAAANDPALGEWLKKEQAFDRAFADKMAEIKPPRGLNVSILQAAESESNLNSASQTHPHPIITPPVAWWRRPSVISIAATGLVLLALTVFLFKPQSLHADNLLEDFYDDMVAHRAEKRPPHHRASDWDGASAFLREHNHPYPHLDSLPSSVRHTDPRGAKILRWREQPVGVVKLNDPTRSYLYTVHRHVFGGSKTITSSSQSREHQGHFVFMWADSEHVYLLVVEGSSAHFQDLGS